jgi:SAM-dependent methyltransferase
MIVDKDVSGFEPLYDAADQKSDGLIPYDIGRPQPVVEALLAYGALRGKVLDPGTGPGYHAIHYAAHGYETTGIDGSPSAITRAKRNAEKTGVTVDFQVADATTLDGFDDRFDTVVDSSFYHVFMDDPEIQTRYARALRCATTPGARLFMFEFSPLNVNGIQWRGIPADNFQNVFGTNGWRIDFQGETTLLARFPAQTLAAMRSVQSEHQDEMHERLETLERQLAVVGPLLHDDLVHLPAWSVAATRLD